MVRNSKGFLSGNTKKLKRRRTLTAVDRVREFFLGNKVFISPKPDFHGLPHLRYKNKYGEVIGKQGNCYKIKIMDGKKEKILICSPVHLTLG